VAKEYNYCCPKLSNDHNYSIKAGRHAVVERLLKQEFIANDINLAPQPINLLTGPNMGGKSTYLRQNALIAILAQIGSYVPASECQIGLVDNIFSRIGAADDLAAGRSTFMVEMVEMAQILHQVTPKSLVVLDEVGRGTATNDGLALAWAMLEYMASKIGCRTLFATHYHELVRLAAHQDNIQLSRVKVRTWQDNIIFDHVIESGFADRSYGTWVAKFAGVPAAIIARAQQLLAQLDANKLVINNEQPSQDLPVEYQNVISEITQIDLNNITPAQAHGILQQLQQQLSKMMIDG
ncbi:MAG: DNA mismatch repair protein MutS, partial [Pseudomonadota bacterium]